MAMTQAQVAAEGASAHLNEEEEDELLEYTASEAADENVEDMDTESDVGTVNTEMMGGLANITIGMGQETGSTTAQAPLPPPPAADQIQQTYQGVLLPWKNRTPESTAAVLQNWVDNSYLCPYPRCEFITSGCRREGKVMRLDRWSDFTDHWYTTHMSPPLVLECQKVGCVKVGKQFYSCKTFTAHLKIHHPNNTDTKIVQKPMQDALETFTKSVGVEISYNTIKSKVVFPSNHLSWRQMREREKTPTLAAATVTTPAHPTVAPVASSASSSSRKSRDETKGGKREASMSSSRARERDSSTAGKRHKTDLIVGRLNMSRADKDLPQAAVIEVTAATQSIKDAFDLNVGAALDKAKINMRKTDYSVDTVCVEINRIREVCNTHRDDVDNVCYSFSNWQKQLGNKPAAIPPNKRLVPSSILEQAQRLSSVESQLNKTLMDNKDLKRKLTEAEETIVKLQAGGVAAKGYTIPRLHMGAAATAKDSIAGSSRVLNRPTPEYEIDLLSEQLANMWRFCQDFKSTK